MFERLFMVLVLLALSDQFSSLSMENEFQRVILREFGLKESPVVTSNRATACIDYLKSLEDAEYNEIDCLDQLDKDGSNFTFFFQQPLKSPDKILVLRMFRSQDAEIKTFLTRITVDVNWHREEVSGNGWLEIEVTELLAGNGEEKISFQVECFSLDMTKTLSFEQVGIVTNGPNRPFLVAKRRKNFKRIKRQGDERLPESNEDEEDLGPSPAELDDQSRACEAVPIYYKFDDYGWDNWIISPKGFSSNICQGKCSFPLKSDLRPSNHAIIQSLMQLMYPDKFPEPCCAPDETESLQIVYFDKNNRPRFRRLHNLVIKSCRCV